MHLLTDAGEDEDERTEENGIRGKMRTLYRLRGDNMADSKVPPFVGGFSLRWEKENAICIFCVVLLGCFA